MEALNNAEAIYKDLAYNFHAVKGYEAIPTDKVKANGKIEYIYRAIPGQINEQNYLKHLTGSAGLTPSPIVNGDECCWGSLDVDPKNYTEFNEGDFKINLIQKAIDLGLCVALSKSGGLQLYAFAKAEVKTKEMIGYLSWARDKLELDPKTELFPKQLEVITDPDGKEKYGNGITIPYRGYFNKPDESPCGINVYNGKIVKLSPFLFIRNFIQKKQLHVHTFKEFADYESKAVKKSDQNLKNFSNLDESIQNSTAKEIYNMIVKENMSLDDDSYFDDMITLFVAKQVVSMHTDKEILEQCNALKNTGADPLYYEKKIKRFRIKSKIDDPEVVHQQIINDVVYIMSRDKYFDLSTNEEYKKEAIDFKYARYF